MNRKEMMNLLHHIITVSRHWHLTYAREHATDKNYQQIVKDRNMFDESLLKKGEDIINDIERESNIHSITIFLKSYKVKLSIEEYSSYQLRQILDDLEFNSAIKEQNSLKKIVISKEEIIGYDVTYESEYEEKFKKSVDKE